MNEYYGTAEPPVRTNGATPFCLLSLLCHCWIQSIYFSHREVFRRVNTFNIDLIGIIRYTIHDSIGKSTFTITDLLVPFTFTELRTKKRSLKIFYVFYVSVQKKISGFSFCQFKKQPLINDQYYWLGIFLQDSCESPIVPGSL